MADCPTGKTVFRSERKAKQSARGITDNGTRMRHYRCTTCGHWHLTSSVDGASVNLSKSRTMRRRKPARTVEELEARAAEIRAGRDPAPNEED